MIVIKKNGMCRVDLDLKRSYPLLHKDNRAADVLTRRIEPTPLALPHYANMGFVARSGNGKFVSAVGVAIHRKPASRLRPLPEPTSTADLLVSLG